MATQHPNQSGKEPEKKAPPAPRPGHEDPHAGRVEPQHEEPHPEGRALGGQEAAAKETPAPEEKVLGKEDAMALFRAGHKLKVKGDPPTKWFAATRAHGVLAISRPVDEDVEKAINSQDLVLVPDAPPANAVYAGLLSKWRGIGWNG